MTSSWTLGLVFIALVTLAISYNVQRARVWIGVGGASFFASTLFLDYGARPDLHPIFTLSCDALVCLSISIWYREEWELGVFIAFLASVFSSLLVLGGFVHDPIVFASLLELCNLGALLWISTTGIVDTVGRHADSPLHRVFVRLHSPRHSIL